jgi:hypothetical protein
MVAKNPALVIRFHSLIAIVQILPMISTSMTQTNSYHHLTTPLLNQRCLEPERGELVHVAAKHLGQATGRVGMDI